MRLLRRWALAGLIAGTAAVLSLPGLAAPENGKTFQDWTVHCDESAKAMVANGCLIVQNVVHNESQRPVMIVAIGFVNEEQMPAAVFTLPLGVRIPPGVAVVIDQNEPLRLPYSWCLPDGCKVRLLLDEPKLASFKAGIGGSLTFQQASGQAVSLPFSLKGFTAALASLQ